MGWWKSKDGDDVLGDEPADKLAAGFKFLFQMTGEKPTFQELIDVTAMLVRSDGEDFLDDPRSLGDGAIEAVFEPPAPTLTSGPEGPIGHLLFNLAADFRGIAALYLDTDLQRKPRLSELLGTLAFVLRVDPQDYLSDAEGLSLVTFRVKEG